MTDVMTEQGVPALTEDQARAVEPGEVLVTSALGISRGLADQEWTVRARIDPDREVLVTDNQSVALQRYLAFDSLARKPQAQPDPGPVLAEVELSRVQQVLTDTQNRVVSLEGDLRRAVSRADQAERDLGASQNLVERIRERMIREAERRGWCDEFDQILEEFGLEGRERTWNVLVNISQDVRVSVRAASEDAAIEAANEWDASQLLAEADSWDWEVGDAHDAEEAD